jgi:alginate O-acetyltransferase complex protein AlgI
MFVGIMLFSITLNYAVGNLMSKSSSDLRRKLFLLLAVAINLSLLVFFKYINFLVDTVNGVTSLIHLDPINLRQIPLPIGISFYTFQCISYLVDVYRRQVPFQKKIVNLALYICLFPHLIAGPIVRYHDIDDQLEKRPHTISLFGEGVERFVIGLCKKILIANPLALVADELFTTPVDNLGFGWAWLGIVCYSLQIYFDFSGYSEMAIGLARMFGFYFPENFNYPYLAQSIQDFWRRWHMSLSNWFRDYLYIPLGGSRVSKNRLLVNLFIVFFATGIWHGASWNFVFWGMFHGTFLVIERMGLGKLLASLWRPLRHAYTLLVVMVGWVFFRADDFTHAIEYLKVMFGAGELRGTVNTFATNNINGLFYMALTLALLANLTVFHKIRTKLYARGLGPSLDTTGPAKLTLSASLYTTMLVVAFGVAMLFVSADTYNPFIYFRF